MDRNETGNSSNNECDISSIEKNGKTSIGSTRSMSSDQIANHQASSAFLVNLFREQGITDFNLVPDNAKPRATVPRSVYLQSPKSDKKSVSRWDSIPRAESLDALDSKKRTRRRASSLGGRQRRSEDSLSLSTSSMSCIARENSRQNTLFEKPTSSLKHNNSSGSSALPHILRDNLLELVLVGEARFGSTPRETINDAAGTASKILNLVNTHSIHAPPLNSPSCLRQKASRRKSTGSLNRSRKQSPRSKSPPHQQPGTPPAAKCALHLPLEPPSKSPPLQQPGTPPSINREQRTRGRRHSDGIIDIDMEVSKKLLHLTQISLSPVQPVRRRSFDSDTVAADHPPRVAKRKTPKY